MHLSRRCRPVVFTQTRPDPTQMPQVTLYRRSRPTGGHRTARGHPGPLQGRTLPVVRAARPVLVGITAGVVVVAVAAGAFLLGRDTAPSSARPAISNSTTTTARLTGGVAVPNVVGLRVAAARAVLGQAGFTVSFTRTPGAVTPPGYVAAELPAAGTVAPRGTTITLALPMWVATTTTTIAPTTQTLMLAPATVLPVVKECSEQLTHWLDGNVAPLICNSGGLNVLAWRFYAPLATAVMSLGRGATYAQVVNAMCVDRSVNHATLPEAKNAATLAAAYYGWSTSILSKLNAYLGSCG